MNNASETIEMPKNISNKAKQAINAIIQTVNHYDNFCSGGGKSFYSPQEWKEREEKYGTESILIVTYDGGDLAPYFNLDYECYSQFESMTKSLDKVGLIAEPCTCWYSAIYKH